MIENLADRISAGTAAVSEIVDLRSDAGLLDQVLKVTVTKWNEDNGNTYLQDVAVTKSELERELVMRKKQVAELESQLKLFQS